MLKPSVEYFNSKIKRTIKNSVQNRIPPILQENMQKKYLDWHSHLKEHNINSDY
jgi:hypothetical protein